MQNSKIGSLIDNLTDQKLILNSFSTAVYECINVGVTGVARCCLTKPLTLIVRLIALFYLLNKTGMFLCGFIIVNAN